MDTKRVTNQQIDRLLTSDKTIDGLLADLNGRDSSSFPPVCYPFAGGTFAPQGRSGCSTVTPKLRPLPINDAQAEDWDGHNTRWWHRLILWLIG